MAGGGEGVREWQAAKSAPPGTEYARAREHRLRLERVSWEA